MKKIAVCISGLIRYWEQTYPLFEHWNNLFDDVEFVFFLSTWKGTDLWYEKERFGNLEFTENDYSKYNFIENYSLHDEKKVNILENHLPASFLKHYSIQQVHKLRKKYEKQNQIFDGIIQTRNDIFISKEILQSCINIQDYFHKSGRYVLTPAATTTNESGALILPNDNFVYSNSKTMDFVMNLYNDIHNQVFNSCHLGEAEFYFKNNIQNIAIDKHPLLFREGKLKKWGRPTPESMKELIDIKGVDWIYNQRVEDLQQNYWSYE